MQPEKQDSEIADNASKSELRNTWEKAAPGWAKWEREFSAGLSSASPTWLVPRRAEVRKWQSRSFGIQRTTLSQNFSIFELM